MEVDGLQREEEYCASVYCKGKKTMEDGLQMEEESGLGFHVKNPNELSFYIKINTYFNIISIYKYNI